MKEIKMSQIKEIYDLELTIFNEENGEHPDYNYMIKLLNRILSILNAITSTKEEKLTIFATIDNIVFNYKSHTLEDIYDSLKNLGYIILDEC